MNSLETLRARHAFDSVGGNPGIRELAKRLPEMLRLNGLLATAGFLLAKPERRSLFLCIVEHLESCQPDCNEIPTGNHGFQAFARWVRPANDGGLSGAALRRVSDEAVAYAEWLKRAAEAEG